MSLSRYNTTIARHLQTIPYGWLAGMLARTARLCMAEVDGATGPLGADSSGVETTRYETVVRPLKRKKDFVEIAQEYLQYHIVAVLGLQIILESGITPSNINDVTMLPPTLYEMRRQRLLPNLSIFHADRGARLKLQLPGAVRDGGLCPTSNREASPSTAASPTEARRPRYSMRKSTTNGG